MKNPARKDFWNLGQDDRQDENIKPVKTDNDEQGNQEQDGDREVSLERQSFLRRINTSFPLSGGESDGDLDRALNDSYTPQEYIKKPVKTVELLPKETWELKGDDEDYRLNDGE